MKAVVTPANVTGTVNAPASKSAMQRACAAALIRKGETVLHNPGISADDKAALNIIQQLGAEINAENGCLKIKCEGIKPVANEIHCGESGLSIRMFTSVSALCSNEITITGSGSLLKRPMEFFDVVLPALGVRCKSNNGFLPLQIKGPLQTRNITIDGSLSSQFLTGLLMAYAAADASDVTVTVENLMSKPYVDLTLEVMKSFGLKIPQNKNYTAFYFPPAPFNASTHPRINYTVEGDWSNAAFLLVAGALAGNVSVKGMKMDSVQGDKTILNVLKKAGARLSVDEGSINISASALKAFDFDATDCPDLFPPLVALAAYCKGISTVRGVHRLTHKESNRAATLQQEFSKMNTSIYFENDSMKIEGSNNIRGTEVFSHNDHRIAMACAVAALKATGETVIAGAHAVKKSYPGFWEHLQQMGVPVTLTDDN